MAFMRGVFQRVKYCSAVYMPASSQWPRNFSISSGYLCKQGNGRLPGQEDEVALKRPHEPKAINEDEVPSKLPNLEDVKTITRTSSSLGTQDSDMEHPQTQHPTRYQRWSTVDLARLTQMRAEGRTSREISKMLGRREYATRRAAVQTGIATTTRSFTKEEDDRILEITSAMSAASANGKISFKELQKQLPHRNVAALIRRYKHLVGGVMNKTVKARFSSPRR